MAFDATRTLSSVFRQSRDQVIAGPMETIKKFGVQARLSEPFIDQIVESYDREPEPTLFGVINAFTRAAHELPPLARIEVERFAGRVLIGKVEVSSNEHKAGEKPAFLFIVFIESCRFTKTWFFHNSISLKGIQPSFF